MPLLSFIVATIKLNNGIEVNSICFTSGAGNDWIAYGVKDIARLLEGYEFSEFMKNPGLVYKFINDHHQLRWLADGVNRMALGPFY